MISDGHDYARQRHKSRCHYYCHKDKSYPFHQLSVLLLIRVINDKTFTKIVHLMNVLIIESLMTMVFYI